MLLASPDLTDFDRVMVVSARFHACGGLPQARRASVHGYPDADYILYKSTSVRIGISKAMVLGVYA